MENNNRNSFEVICNSQIENYGRNELDKSHEIYEIQ